LTFNRPFLWVPVLHVNVLNKQIWTSIWSSEQLIICWITNRVN